MNPSAIWNCVGAAACGEAHVRRGAPCQDAWTAAQIDDVLLLAVADGAGSAARAEEGSARAVAAALNALISSHPVWGGKHLVGDRAETFNSSMRDVLSSVYSVLSEIAVSENVQVSDFATTLLVVVAAPTFTAAVQVGDGAIVCAVDEASDIVALTRPQHGDFVNVTSFITGSDYLEQAQFCYLPNPVRYLALMTDGLEPVAIEFQSGNPCAGLFKGLFQYMAEFDRPIFSQSVNDWLTSERICERSDDDKTLLLACRLQAGAAGLDE